MDILAVARSRPWLASVAEISSLSAHIDSDDFTGLVTVLADSGRRWFLAGQGRSGLVAAMVAMRLMHLGRECHVVGEATAPAVRTGDGLIAISGSGATTTTLHHARTARAEAATIAAVTRCAASDLARLADVTLRIPAQSSAQLGGNLFEQAALIALDSAVNTLATGMPDAREQLRCRHSNMQ